MSTSFKERQAITATRAGAGEPEQARQMSPTEREWKQRTYERLLKVLDLSLLGSLAEDDARSQIREITNRLLLEDSAPLSLAQRQFVTRRIEDEVMGHGPLEPLLADPTISDILVNGSDQVYVERYGKLELTEVRFNDDAHLMNIIDRIVSAVGRRVDESSPMVDARLKDGSRVNVIIPPLALDGPVLSIRRFGIDLLKADDLIRLGTIDEPLARILNAIVLGRLNVVISGGTGTGKTTLLNILSGFVPHTERIVTIEDSAELQLQQPHVVRLETRPPNIEGKGERHAARPGAQQPAHAARPDHRRRSARGRGARHVAGHEHGSRRLADHDPRELAARCARPHRDHGLDDGDHFPDEGAESPDGLRDQHRAADRPGRGWSPPRRQPAGGQRHGRGRHHHVGDLHVRAHWRGQGGQRARQPQGRQAWFPDSSADLRAEA